MDKVLLTKLIGNRIAYLRVLVVSVIPVDDFSRGYLSSIRSELEFLESLESLCYGENSCD